jgi:DNA-binding CsgD family transcriptional regulator
MGHGWEPDMRHSPGFYKRLAVLSLQKEFVRGGLSVILLVVLFAVGLPIWLIVGLPLLMYGGLSVATATVLQMPETKQEQPLPRSGKEAFAKCLELQREIKARIDRVEDAKTAEHFHRNICWIDKIMEAIAEDGKYEAARSLFPLIGLTYDLLVDYLRVVRRGLGDTETHEAVCESLETLEVSFKRFWEALNRDAVVNLRALSESIDAIFSELTRPRQDDRSTEGTSKETPAIGEQVSRDQDQSPARSIPPAVVSSIALLSPREREVLCLLPTGKTDQEIADELFISRRTVTTHVENICTKLEVRNRTEAAAFAVRYGLC